MGVVHTLDRSKIRLFDVVIAEVHPGLVASLADCCVVAAVAEIAVVQDDCLELELGARLFWQYSLRLEYLRVDVAAGDLLPAWEGSVQVDDDSAGACLPLRTRTERWLMARCACSILKALAAAVHQLMDVAGAVDVEWFGKEGALRLRFLLKA